jgi:hypothetical protein
MRKIKTLKVLVPYTVKSSMQNLQTCQHLRNLYAKVTVISGQDILRSNNISVPNGDSSINSTFNNEGTFHISLVVPPIDR